jgi:sugar phosphate isomerase/epimerase
VVEYSFDQTFQHEGEWMIAQEDDLRPGDLKEPRSYERTLNPALHGCETFDFAPSDLAALRVVLERYPAFSVHAPLPTPPDYPGLPVTSFLLDPDVTKRQASLQMLHQTIEQAAEWGAMYVVVHFGGLHSNGLSAQEIRVLADDAAARLNEWARMHRISLHLEYGAYHPSFATPEELVDLVCRYSHLDVCLDVGHLQVGAEILGRDVWQMARVLAPYTRSMHLWTLRDRRDVRTFHHVPVHPSLVPADGWLDIPGMLSLVLGVHADCAIVFEPHHVYNPDLVWQAEGIAWVREIVAGYTA